MGLAGYYGRFIKNFAELFAVLYRTTSRAANFCWNEGMQKAFDELKLKLTTAPVLALPDFEQQFIVGTDTSSVAVGAVWSEKKEDDRLHSV